MDVGKRTNSKELLDVYIKAYEKEVGVDRKKSHSNSSHHGNSNSNSNSNSKQHNSNNNHHSHKKIDSNRSQSKDIPSSTRRERITLGNSIETIEKRIPSVDRNQFSTRIKTEPSSTKKEEREGNSINKFISKIWNKISPREESLKKKEDLNIRKKSMKNYIN